MQTQIVEKVETLILSHKLMERCTECFAVPGSSSIIDFVHPDTGRSVIENETLEEIRDRSAAYKNAVLITYDEWAKAKSERQRAPIVWTETSRDHYHEMLGCVPPVNFTGAGFLVGEPFDSDVLTGQPRFSGFRIVQGRFYEGSRPMTVKEHRSALETGL
jgi:hypothetical protein